MTDVDAAAARLRRLKASADPLFVYECVDEQYPNAIWLARRDRDRERLADAWLAEHRADDAEAVTADWLRAVGFYFTDPDSPRRGLRTRCGLHVVEDIDGWRLLDFLTVNRSRLPTRGHVRRLAAALGITLEEILS